MIILEKGSTSFRVICSDVGKIGDNNDFDIRAYLNYYLSEYEYDNFGHRILKYKYAFFDKSEKYLYFPKHFLTHLTDTLVKYRRNFEIRDIISTKYLKINNSVNSIYEDRDNQSEIIDYLLSSDNSMRCVELQTGFGKTYIAIKVSILLKRTILILPPTHLIEQWKEEILSISDLMDDDIYIIQKKESVFELAKDNFKKKYKCYIGSMSTLVNFLQNTNGIYTDFLSYQKFMKKLKIGVKVIDEVHLKFHQTVLLDMVSNIDINIYLSATYIRSDRVGNTIFQRTFPEKIRYQDKDYDRYTNITEYNYSLGYINPNIVVSKRGYAQYKYEKYLMKVPSKFNPLFEFISTIFSNRYLDIKKDGDKCLILVKMKDFADLISRSLRIEYNTNLKIGKYVYETPEDELKNLDVIVSTIGSCGLGVDIPNLRTVILFDSFKTESWIYQTLGRLRRLPDRIPEFCFMHNRDLPSHIFHRKRRREILSKLTKNYMRIDF